jgi:hypothetical protein
VVKDLNIFLASTIRINKEGKVKNLEENILNDTVDVVDHLFHTQLAGI